MQASIASPYVYDPVILGRIGAEETGREPVAEPLRQGSTFSVSIGCRLCAAAGGWAGVATVGGGMPAEQQGVLDPLEVLLEQAVVHEGLLPLGDELPLELLGELHHGRVGLAVVVDRSMERARPIRLALVGVGRGSHGGGFIGGGGIAPRVLGDSTFRDILRPRLPPVMCTSLPTSHEAATWAGNGGGGGGGRRIGLDSTSRGGIDERYRSCGGKSSWKLEEEGVVDWGGQRTMK